MEDSISILYGIIFLLVFAPILSLAFVEQSQTASLKEIRVWSIIELAFFIAGYLFGQISYLVLLLFFAYIMFRIFLFRKIAMRLHSFGKSKWWGLFAFPLSPIFSLVFLFVKTNEEKFREQVSK